MSLVSIERPRISVSCIEKKNKILREKPNSALKEPKLRPLLPYVTTELVNPSGKLSNIAEDVIL